MTVFLICFTAKQPTGLTYGYAINRLTGGHILSAVKTLLSRAVIGMRPFHTENLLPKTYQSYLYHMAVFFVASELLNLSLFLSRKKAFYKVYLAFWPL